MDINFHYYAVKAIAVQAGFNDAESQCIASYSQFVDDFNAFMPIYFRHVPEWARYLAYDIKIGYTFFPATTGFSDWFDMTMLAIPSNQKWIIVPFHFIPKYPLASGKNLHGWRVCPAMISEPVSSLIQQMLIESRELLHNETEKRTENLMHIGMLLHTFADTYAHQQFSGFHGWENYSRLTRAIDNSTSPSKDVLVIYNPDMSFKYPSIGHANVNHAPDDSNICFEMVQKQSEDDALYRLVYGRNNTDEFCGVAKKILNFLLSCCQRPYIENKDWEDFQKLLAKGFLTPLKDITQLNDHWRTIFPTVTFSYNKDNMVSTMISSADLQLSKEEKKLFEMHGLELPVFYAGTDVFFRYNVIADAIRRRVVGEALPPQVVDVRLEALRADAETKFGVSNKSNHKA